MDEVLFMRRQARKGYSQITVNRLFKAKEPTPGADRGEAGAVPLPPESTMNLRMAVTGAYDTIPAIIDQYFHRLSMRKLCQSTILNFSI